MWISFIITSSALVASPGLYLYYMKYPWRILTRWPACSLTNCGDLCSILVSQTRAFITNRLLHCKPIKNRFHSLYCSRFGSVQKYKLYNYKNGKIWLDNRYTYVCYNTRRIHRIFFGNILIRIKLFAHENIYSVKQNILNFHIIMY